MEQDYYQAREKVHDHYEDAQQRSSFHQVKTLIVAIVLLALFVCVFIYISMQTQITTLQQTVAGQATTISQDTTLLHFHARQPFDGSVCYVNTVNGSTIPQHWHVEIDQAVGGGTLSSTKCGPN